MTLSRFLCSFAVYAALGSVVSYAQSAPVVEKGTFEVGGFAGASHGIDKFRVMGGGNISYGLTKWLLPYAEFSYFPGLPREQVTSDSGTQQRLSYDAPLYDFHGGVHLRVRIAESRIVPYGVFGVGALHSSFNGLATIRTGNVTGTFPLNESNTDLAINVGGGLRYYATQRWGFRVEAKTYRPVTGRYDNLFYKAEGGFFFQFR